MEAQQPEGDGVETRPEQEPKLDPRIYVASLSDYNAGRLHGAWLSAAVEQEELEARVQSMLDTSPSPGAEEFAIFDYEGFGPLHLDEYESLSTVARIGRGIGEHGPAYAHWAALIGTTDPDAFDRFEDAYLGRWDSLEAYAEELLEDLGVYADLEQAVDDHLQPYVRFDVAAFARDLEFGGQITMSTAEGAIYLFDGGL